MGDIYGNIEEYSPNKKCKIQIVFDDMIADILSNKKLNTVVTELFIRGRKQNFSLVFVAESYFAVPKKYQTRFYTLLYYKNSRQIRASTHFTFQKESFRKKIKTDHDDKIRDEKLQYDINRHATKTLELS